MTKIVFLLASNNILFLYVSFIIFINMIIAAPDYKGCKAESRCTAVNGCKDFGQCYNQYCYNMCCVDNTRYGCPGFVQGKDNAPAFNYSVCYQQCSLCKAKATCCNDENKKKYTLCENIDKCGEC